MSDQQLPTDLIARGYRWLEVGEIIRPGDCCLYGDTPIPCDQLIHWTECLAEKNLVRPRLLRPDMIHLQSKLKARERELRKTGNKPYEAALNYEATHIIQRAGHELSELLRKYGEA